MSGRRARILLVEDTPSDAELIVQALGGDGLQVTVARDGVEALDQLLRRGAFKDSPVDQRPTLVILDIKLPRVDGFEVLEALRADPSTRALPVVMLTSSIVERDVARCYRLGANSYVQKPVHFDEFRTTIAALGAYWLNVNVAPPDSAFTGDSA
jgi:two-component system response regulator